MPIAGEPMSHKTQMTGRPGTLTLAQFKQQLAQRGAFRYWFKRAADGVSGGAVYDQIADDDAVLPLLEGTLYARLVRDSPA